MRYFGLLALALALTASPAEAKKKHARAAKVHTIKHPKHASAKPPVEDLEVAVAEKRRQPEPATTAAAPPSHPVSQELDDEVPGQKRHR